MGLVDLVDRPELKYPPFTPGLPVAVALSALYGVMTVVEMVRQATFDGRETEVMVEAQPPSTAARPANSQVKSLADGC